MEPRTFYYSKGAYIFYFVGILIIAGISFLMLLDGDTEIYKKIIAGIVLPISIYLAYVIFKTSLSDAYRKKPALVLDEKGVYIDGKEFIITWDNITKVIFDFIQRRGNVICIYIKDKKLISDQTHKDFDEERIEIDTFGYAGGDSIFNALKTFCHEYNPGEVIFGSRRETWPSEGQI